MTNNALLYGWPDYQNQSRPSRYQNYHYGCPRHTLKNRLAAPSQRKDWLDDDYAYPHRNPVQTVQASARDFSQVNPRARDYKFRSVTALGRQLEQAILTYGPLDAWWLARHVSNSHTVGIVSKSEVSAALNSSQGRIFKIAWTDNGKPIWDLII